MSRRFTIGVIGTGHLASAVIEGMMQTENQYSFILSPRNEKRSEDLDKKYPRCRKARSSQEVLEVCDAAILSVPPSEYGVVAGEVRWPFRLPMLSFLVGVDTHRLKEAFGCNQVFRILPFPSASLSESPTLLYPDAEPARSICEMMGEVIPLKSEEEFDLYTGVTPLAGFSYYLMECIQRWCGDSIPVEYPAKIIRSTLSLYLSQKKQGKDVSTDQFATPGGLTSHAFRVLDSSGMCDMMASYLDAVWERLGSIDRKES